MPTPTRILRRTRTLLWTAFSIVVILMAVVVGVGQLLMPYSVHYQPELERWLSTEFGQPVAIDSFEGSWTAFGPRLTLSGLTLLGRADLPGEGAAEVVIESAALEIRPLAYLLAGRPLYNFRVIGARFVLRRDAEGAFELSGFGVSNRGSEGGSPLTELARVGEVVLQDSGLEYIDEMLDIRVALDGIDGRLALDGDDLATQVDATLFDRRSGLSYGKLVATAVLRTGEDRRIEAAEWHAEAGELMLAALQGKVPVSPFMPLTGWLDAEIWGGWSSGSGHRINGVVNLRDALLTNDYQDLHIERVNSRFRWRFSDRGHWNLHLADFLFDHGEAEWTSPRLSVARNVSEGAGLWISADALPVGFPLGVVRDVMSMYDRPWPEKLTLTADGQVSDLDLVLSESWQIRMARGRLSDAVVTGRDRLPTVIGLGAEFELGDGYGQVWLDGGTVQLDWPRMFREPLIAETTPCRIDVGWGEGWQAGFQGCGVENGDAATYGDLWLRGNVGRPSMDLNFLVSRGKVGQIDPYWPEAHMPDQVKAWLRRGLLDGELRQGRVLIRGDLDDWPFRNGTGQFDAVAWLERPLIDFQEGWPVVQGGEAVAHFAGPGMAVHGSVEDTGGVAVQEIFVGIEDMKTPVLEVEYSGSSDLPGLLDYLEQTPLTETVDVDLSAFEFAGPADVSGRIVLPLGESPGELAVDGMVLIDGGRFSDPEHGVTIDGIRGAVAYNERGFAGSGLEASVFGDPARLDLVANADGEEKFRTEIRGNFDVRELLLDEQLREALPMLERIEGRSDWRVSLSVAPGDDRERNEVRLGVLSELEGVVIDLPAPLAKVAEERLPFALEYPLGEGGRPLDIRLDDRVALLFDMPGERAAPRRALISLGGETYQLPDEGLLRIKGFTPYLDLDGWVSLVMEESARGTELGGLELEESRLLAGGLLFLDRRFPVVELGVSVTGGEIQASFESQDIDGTIRYGGSPGAGSLSAEFERLALGEPESTGVTMDTDPKELPALHLYARSLQYAGIDLGEIRIEAFPTADGFHFEKVDAMSDALSIQASGDWLMGDNGHRSDFRVNMASESLGDFLRSMDISSSVQGGQTMVNLDAWWPGTPASFALSRINGQVEFSVVDGNITGADAGPGRLLGLVSFTALPKRLALDFRDVFESGFPFDEATGTFSLDSGKASTDDVLLKSSSASIHVIGQTDLVERRYDQLMTIRPGVGNTLPIIGALAAGPGGAAAGLALQGLLHDSLGEATQVRYTITGSWDDPVIEPVEVERAGG